MVFRQPHPENLLLGFHFNPTDEDLLFHLREKARGGPLPSNAVVEKSIYDENANPWQIFSDDDPWEIAYHDAGESTRIEKVVYVIAKASRMGPKRRSRTTGCGSWEAQTKPIFIENDRGEIIGSKTMLNSTLKRGSESKDNGHWTMHEYELAGVSLDGIGRTDYVICKITRDYSKSSKEKEYENSTTSHQVLGKIRVEEENDNTAYLKRQGGFLSATSYS